jgi:hypothetical protein
VSTVPSADVDVAAGAVTGVGAEDVKAGGGESVGAGEVMCTRDGVVAGDEVAAAGVRVGVGFTVAVGEADSDASTASLASSLLTMSWVSI